MGGKQLGEQGEVGAGSTDLRTAEGPSLRSRHTRAAASWPPDTARGPSNGPAKRGPAGRPHRAVTPPGWAAMAAVPVRSPSGPCVERSPAALPQQKRPPGTAAIARILQVAFASGWCGRSSVSHVCACSSVRVWVASREGGLRGVAAAAAAAAAVLDVCVGSHV